MLPPVTAVSAGDFSFSAAAPRSEPTNTAVTVPSLPQVTQDTSASSPAAVARALSGELQLQQGGTILAETLGKLLNIARMDGETADAYVGRLVATMQALPADQLASLEKQLGSLLKGMTVSILIEALKNASGPDAARLAALFEIARATQTGDGAKPALPAYLQDIQPDEPALIFRPATAGQPQAPASSPLSVAPAAQQVEQAQGNSVAAAAKPPITPIEGETHKPSPQLTTSAAQPNTTAQNLAKPLAPALPVQTTSLPEKMPLPAGSPAGSGVYKAAEPAAPVPTAPIAAQAKPAVIVQNTALPAAEIDEANPIAAKLIAAGAPLAAANAFITAEQFRGASPQDMEKLLLAVLLGKLPQSAETPPTASPLTSQLPQPEPHAEQAPKHNPASASPAPAGADAAQAETQEAASALRQDMHLAARAATAADAKTAILDQPLLQSAVASLVTKEATPLPFVNYPIEKEEEESDAPHRGRWPSSESEAEGEQGYPEDQHAEDEAQQEERTAANDANVDQSLSDGAHEDGRVGDAESYYLRMSNFA
ncbi:hypothetical protein [Agrobacterium larrymoorei]|uniref:Flagellar hook-length control protein FliK n=1 Tax=Agrobacterium larrymoorei TaxID=160699 RepID=A0A4D7E121_9HYPH|nr:hypothetical protein [Agrobacterium larrymoorei]QCJ00023.1 hypothetical protein CFBP5473_18965 [Agrobacterium larrymoorei]QYA09534.1 hypothetical protein J5285_19380 [Agrobacterium larrymoorei]